MEYLFLIFSTVMSMSASMVDSWRNSAISVNSLQSARLQLLLAFPFQMLTLSHCQSLSLSAQPQ
jgi:hypothetical protein